MSIRIMLARCMCLLKFSFEIIYKVTSILCNTDSYYKSKVLSELGKKKRKLYIQIYHKYQYYSQYYVGKEKSRQAMHAIKAKKK